MVETQVSKSSIVRDILEEYSDPSNRALYNGQENGTCQYESPDGKRCAVGRFMTDKALSKVGRSTKKIQVLSFKYGLDNLLKPEYQGFPLLFWKKIQNLHDNSDFWSEDGITEEGLSYIRRELEVEV